MTAPDCQQAVEALLALEGVTGVEVEVTLRPTVRLRNTGEVDDFYQEIRERAASESTVDAAVPDGWSYHGVVDVVGDYHVKDRISYRGTEP